MNTGACASIVPVDGPVSTSPFPVNMVELTLCRHHQEIKIQFGFSIKLFQFDNYLDYCSSIVNEFCVSCGIIYGKS